MALHKLVRSNYGRKSPVSIKYENLHSFKEGRRGNSLLSMYPWSKKNIMFTCLSSLYNPFKSMSWNGGKTGGETKKSNRKFFSTKMFLIWTKNICKFSGLLLVEKHEGNKRWNIKNMIKNFKFLFCFSRFARALKVHYCRFADLPISSSSHKNNMPKISHYSTLYTLTDAH